MEIALKDLCRKGSLETIEMYNPTFYFNMLILEKEEFFWTYPVFDTFVVSEFQDILPALRKIAEFNPAYYYGNVEKFLLLLFRNNIISEETEKRMQNLNCIMKQKNIPIKRFSTYPTHVSAYHVEIAEKAKANSLAKKFCSK